MSGGDARERSVPAEGTRRNPGDEASPEAAQTAENICRACGGSGSVDGKTCPDCGGTGKVTETVGDA